MAIDINNYDYALFVDASGCDGTKFDKGSSICYAVAGYLVPVSDIPADIATLSQIRQIICGDPTRELKYSTLRRHRKRSDAFSLFSSFHGRAIGRVSFKKVLLSSNQFDTNYKAFTAIAHAVTISLLSYCEEVFGKKVLIVVDRMKYTEESPVHFLANNQMQDALQRLSSYDLIFRDSKDKNYQLIQVADFISGILREFFELYETDPIMSDFWRKCYFCNNAREKHLCGKKGRSARSILIYRNTFQYVYSMFFCPQCKQLSYPIAPDPVAALGSIYYLYCAKI